MEKKYNIYKDPAATDAYLDKIALAMVEQLNKKVTTEPLE